MVELLQQGQKVVLHCAAGLPFEQDQGELLMGVIRSTVD